MASSCRKAARRAETGTIAVLCRKLHTGGTRAQAVKKRVDGAYVLEADGSVGFRLRPYDPHATMVIDPSLAIVYATFLGGSGKDSATSVAVDTSGKIYVGGTATSVTGFLGATAHRLGGAPAGISGVAVTGANSGDFELGNSCAPSLGAGRSCQIGVSFSPGSSAPTGIRSATLNITGDSPPIVSLSGTATLPGISVPSGLNFGNQLSGTAGTAQPVTVTNNSGGPFAGALAIASVAKSGPNTGDFAVTTEACTGQDTPLGGTCAIQVAFKPAQSAMCGAAAETRSATLVIADNAPGSPHSIPLSGTAMDFCINAPPGQGVSEPIPGIQMSENLDRQVSGSGTGRNQSDQA